MAEARGILCRECRGTGIHTRSPRDASGKARDPAKTAVLTAWNRVPCPACGGAGVVWALPCVKIVWKGEEASGEVYERFLDGRVEALRVDRFDGSLGFLIYLLEETLGRRIWLALRNRAEGVVALYAEDPSRPDRTEVLLAREPLRRPHDYRQGEMLTLCRVVDERGRHAPGRGAGERPGLALYERWRRGRLERIDLEGASEFCGLVRNAAVRFGEKLAVRVVAAYRNRQERLIALLAVDESGEWKKVGFVPEFRMREQLPFWILHVTVGGREVAREDFPELP